MRKSAAGTNDIVDRTVRLCNGRLQGVRRVGYLPGIPMEKIPPMILELVGVKLFLL